MTNKRIFEFDIFKTRQAYSYPNMAEDYGEINRHGLKLTYIKGHYLGSVVIDVSRRKDFEDSYFSYRSLSNFNERLYCKMNGKYMEIEANENNAYLASCHLNSIGVPEEFTNFVYDLVICSMNNIPFDIIEKKSKLQS